MENEPIGQRFAKWWPNDTITRKNLRKKLGTVVFFRYTKKYPGKAQFWDSNGPLMIAG